MIIATDDSDSEEETPYFTAMITSSLPAQISQPNSLTMSLSSHSEESLSDHHVLDIEKGVEPVAEMYEFFKSPSDKIRRRTMGENLFTLCCTVALNAIELHDDPSRHEDLWNTAHTKFDDNVNSLTSQEYYSKTLFAWIPEKTWPKYFHEYIADLKARPPSETWKKKFKKSASMSEEDQKKLFFGYNVVSAFTEAKSEISANLNPKWKDHLNEGETETALLAAIRRSLWPHEAEDRSKNSIKQAIRRSNKASGGKQAYTGPEFDEMVRVRTDQLTSNFNELWYPKCWVTFCLLGRPARMGRPTEVFIAGMARAPVAVPVAAPVTAAAAPSSGTKKSGGSKSGSSAKGARGRKSTSSSISATAAAVPVGEDTPTTTPEGCSSRTALTAALISTLEKRKAYLEADLQDSDEEVRTGAKHEIKEVRKRLRECLKQHTAELDAELDAVAETD